MKKLGFIVVLTLAIFLRLLNLGSVPPSASLDEASITYNAYSVLRTGGDEFGEFPLISQRGYDDWRRSTYLLLEIPFVAVFGLSVYAARLPAVILSILTVVATYFIVLELFRKQDNRAYITATLASILLAISPWHVYISRIGHESNACLSFLVFAVLAFLKGLKKPKILLLSYVFFVLSMISYYSGQIFVPLFVTGLIIFYRNDLRKIAFKSKKTLSICIVLILLLVPVFWAIFSPDALIRYRGTSILSPEVHGERFEKIVELRNKAVENNDLIGTLLFNRRVFFARVLFENYTSHFNPEWLFLNPSNGIFKAPNLGFMYLWEFPFILLGLVAVIFSKKISKNAKLLIIMWLLLGPLPATIATQAPHGMRSYNVLPTWQIIGAFGMVALIYKIGRQRILLSLLGILFAYGFITIYQHYFILFPREHSKSFQYALAKTIPFIIQNEDKYESVVFSNKDNLFQSYMLFLYHSKYDPKLYRSQGGTLSGGYDESHTFGKYEFRPIDWEKENKQNTLFVANPGDIPESVTPMFVGKYLNGDVGIIVVSQ